MVSDGEGSNRRSADIAEHHHYLGGGGSLHNGIGRKVIGNIVTLYQIGQLYPAHRTDGHNHVGQHSRRLNTSGEVGKLTSHQYLTGTLGNQFFIGYEGERQFSFLTCCKSIVSVICLGETAHGSLVGGASHEVRQVIIAVIVVSIGHEAELGHCLTASVTNLERSVNRLSSLGFGDFLVSQRNPSVHGRQSSSRARFLTFSEVVSASIVLFRHIVPCRQRSGRIDNRSRLRHSGISLDYLSYQLLPDVSFSQLMGACHKAIVHHHRGNDAAALVGRTLICQLQYIAFSGIEGGRISIDGMNLYAF